MRLAVETLEELDWCLDQLESLQVKSQDDYHDHDHDHDEDEKENKDIDKDKDVDNVHDDNEDG